MEEPPDPGGSVPQATCFITLPSNESDMETDTSVASNSVSVNPARKLKRPRTHKTCRHCNKRRRKRNSTTECKETDCTCDPISSINEKDQAPIAELSHPLHNILPDCQVNSLPTPTRPQPMPVGRLTYEHSDLAPYIVHIQKEHINPNDSISLHPVAFGKFLRKENFVGIVNGSLKKIGRNRMSLTFTDFNTANIFLNHVSHKKNGFKTFIPTSNITRMGVVRGVPAEWSPEEVCDNISVPIGCGKILKTRRLNYRTVVDGSPVWKPSQTVVLTFDGQVLPMRIYMCYNTLPVELYTYPTIQCYNCARFGHTKIQCRSLPRCYKCGQAHTGETCNISEDKATCCHCSGSHFATSKSCPELDRQKRIKRSMAESCISYVEANKIHPPVVRSYADITSNHASSVGRSANNFPASSPILSSPVKSTSYKKTITRQPSIRQHHPSNHLSSHKELTKDFQIPCPANGCAYKDQLSKENPPSIIDVILTLISSLSHSTIIKPDHVASIVETLNKLAHTHDECNSQCFK